MNYPNINEMRSDMIGAMAVVSAHMKLYEKANFMVFLFCSS